MGVVWAVNQIGTAGGLLVGSASTPSFLSPGATVPTDLPSDSGESAAVALARLSKVAQNPKIFKLARVLVDRGANAPRNTRQRAGRQAGLVVGADIDSRHHN